MAFTTQNTYCYFIPKIYDYICFHEYRHLWRKVAENSAQNIDSRGEFFQERQGAIEV
jgi:hypothetical protein